MIETVQNLVNNPFVISGWEVIFYVTIITVYALMGRTHSCLINTFAFTLYWGFMSIVSSSSANTFPESALLIYTLSGLWIYAVFTLASLKPSLIKRRGLEIHLG